MQACVHVSGAKPQVVQASLRVHLPAELPPARPPTLRLSPLQRHSTHCRMPSLSEVRFKHNVFTIKKLLYGKICLEQNILISNMSYPSRKGEYPSLPTIVGHLHN